MAAMTLEERQARVKDIETRLKEIVTEYERDGIPDDVKEEWNSLNVELEEQNKIITEKVSMRARLDEIADDPRRATEDGSSFGIHSKKSERDIYDLVGVRNESRSPEHEVDLLRSNALTAVQDSRFVLPAQARKDADGNPLPTQNVEDVRGHIADLIDGDSTGEIARRILQTGSSTYRRAFGKAASGKNMTPDEQRALTTVTTGGGYAIPFALDPTFIHVSNFSVNPYRFICRNVSITGSNTWQGVTTTGVTASYVIEGGTAADNAPSFLQPQATVQRAHCFVPYSYEVDGDIAGLQGEVTQLFADAKDDLEAVQFTTGTGTAPAPVGILGVQGLGTAAPPKVLTIGTAILQVADIDAAQVALAPRWRARATWVANLGFYQRVRRFYAAGGETLQPAGGPGNTQGFQSVAPFDPGGIGYGLLGRPAFECTAINTTNVTTTGTKQAIFGDFSRGMIIVDRVGMNVEVIPNLMTSGLPTGQRGLLAWWRNATVLAAPSAFVYLQTL